MSWFIWFITNGVIIYALYRASSLFGKKVSQLGRLITTIGFYLIIGAVLFFFFGKSFGFQLEAFDFFFFILQWPYLIVYSILLWP